MFKFPTTTITQGCSTAINNSLFYSKGDAWKYTWITKIIIYSQETVSEDIIFSLLLEEIVRPSL